MQEKQVEIYLFLGKLCTFHGKGVTLHRFFEHIYVTGDCRWARALISQFC